jgi:hypothetical protein
MKSEWSDDDSDESSESNSVVDLNTLIAIINSSSIPKVHKNKPQKLMQNSIVSGACSEPLNSSSSASSLSTIKMNESSSKSTQSHNTSNKDLLNFQMNNLMSSFLNQNFFNANELTSSDILVSTTSCLNLKHEDTSVELNESKHCLEENYSDKTSKGKIKALTFKHTHGSNKCLNEKFTLNFHLKIILFKYSLNRNG